MVFLCLLVPGNLCGRMIVAFTATEVKGVSSDFLKKNFLKLRYHAEEYFSHNPHELLQLNYSVWKIPVKKLGAPQRHWCLLLQQKLK